MVATRKRLQEILQDRLLHTYGCAAHYLNLVEGEVSPKTVLAQIIEVQKFFRNHHQPSAWLIEKNGDKPQIPNSTRWNSQDACVETFLNNYQKYHEICSEHPEVDRNIFKIINNAAIHIESMHLQKQLKVVSKCLNIMQKDNCNIGDAVHAWLELMKSPVLDPYKSVVKKRFNQCITPLHLVAYQVHPKYKGEGLSQEQDQAAANWLKEIGKEALIPVILSLSINDNETFPSTLLETKVIETFSAVKWWRILKTKLRSNSLSILNEEVCDFILTICSLPASSASVERTFSTFGTIHTKLRNRLGNKTTEKLVMCNRILSKGKEYDNW